MNKYFIYTISINDIVIYVGRTKNPQNRFSQHIQYSYRYKYIDTEQLKLYRYIRYYLGEKIYPVFDIIAGCKFTDEASNHEKFYINKFKSTIISDKSELEFKSEDFNDIIDNEFYLYKNKEIEKINKKLEKWK